jgi:2'-hydroxyisoflavone reductase
MTGKNLLVLGGTGWVARFVAEIAIAQGIEVTCLARGSKAKAPAGARFVRADRTRPNAYDELVDRDWDEVIDVTWQPGQARTAVAALADRAAHWTYVSSGAVYMGVKQLGETVAPLASDTATDPEYGAAKVACETAVLDAIGDRATIARVGLIGGPGDRSEPIGLLASPVQPCGGWSGARACHRGPARRVHRREGLRRLARRCGGRGL